MKPKGYILLHEGGIDHSIAFDIIKRKDVKIRLKDIGLYNDGGGCDKAEDFIKSHKGYEGLGSEDLLHSMACNAAMLTMLAKLVKRGFVITAYNEKVK